MSPDELRAAAALLDRMAEINAEQHPDETLARKQLDIGAKAARNLADVIEYAEPFAGKQFAGFAAMWDAHPEMVEVVRIARGETTSHEDRRER